MPRFLFVVNRSSGSAGGAERIASLIEEWSHASARDAVVALTSSIDDLDRLWSSEEFAQCDVVCAVGGDGTVLELGRRLSHTKKALAVLPVGSGNGFARHLGIPMKPTRALEALETAVPVSIDSGLADGHRFLGTFGVGFDALVAHQFSKAGTRGLATYMRVGASSFFSYEAQSYRIIVDGEETLETALLLTVGNSSQYGNDARIIPNASLRDGLLDVCVLRSAAIADAPRILTKLFSGRFHECAEVCLLRGREIIIERSAPGPAHVDGDPFEAGARITVRIDPQSLTVMVPQHRADHI